MLASIIELTFVMIFVCNSNKGQRIKFYDIKKMIYSYPRLDISTSRRIESERNICQKPRIRICNRARRRILGDHAIWRARCG